MRGRAIARDESGETLISFSLTFPILIGVIFGLMQMCLAYYNYERISELAREGTRWAMVRGSTCMLSSGTSCTATSTSVNSYVSGIGLPGLGGGTMTVATSYPDGDEVPGHRVQVRVTYTYPYKIPFEGTSGISMSSTSVMYILL